MFSTIIAIILFVFGFFILIKGADFVIRGATSVAHYLGVSEWLIGVVIVGIGTSLPELAININSAFEGTSVGVGTVFGSNLFNMLAILGMVAFISPVVMRPEWIRRDLPINIGVIMLTGAALLFPISGGNYYGITRPEALLLFMAFIVWIRFMALRKDDDIEQPHSEYADTSAWYISALLIVAGLVGVFVGSEWIVDGAQKVARLAGMSEGLIGLTIVALGTSIPEIAISIRAITKKNTALAIGNILGSNIFDLIGIFGIAGLIATIPMPEAFLFDYLFLLFTSILLFAFMFIGKINTISKTQGLILILTYFTYLIIIIIRG